MIHETAANFNLRPQIHPFVRNLSAARHAEPGAEAACLFYGTPNAPQKRAAFRRKPAQIAEQSSARAKRSDHKVARMSHAKRCADRGVASEGWDPKNRQPRSDRLLTCRSLTQYIMPCFVIVFSSGRVKTTENVKDWAVWGLARDVL